MTSFAEASNGEDCSQLGNNQKVDEDRFYFLQYCHASSSDRRSPRCEHDAVTFTVPDHRTFRAPCLEQTAPLFDLGPWAVYMALKAVFWYHLDRATRTFGESGP